MKTAMLALALLLTLTVTGPGGADPSPQQSGDNSDCTDYNALFQHRGIHSPLAARVEVVSDTHYVLSHNGGATAFVDFYDASGSWLGFNNAGRTSGRVPPAADYGTVCVGSADLWPTFPAAGATWIYQDGL